MDKAITVTFTSVSHLPKTRSGVDFLFEYKYVDSKYIGEPEEVSKTLKGEILTGISDTLIAVWGLNDISNLKKILFEHAKRHLITKFKWDALKQREEIMLSTNNTPQKCPYDPGRIKYLINVPIKFVIQSIPILSKKETESLPVFPDITPSSIKESKHYEFEYGDFKTKTDIDNLIQLMFEESECPFYYFTEKGKGITEDLLVQEIENGSIIKGKIDFHYYRHPNNKRDYVKIEVRDNNYEWEWERDLVKNTPMFMKIKLNLSKRKRMEMETLLKISMEDALRKNSEIKDNKNIPIQNNHTSKSTPESFEQVLLHYFWPLDNLRKILLFIFIILLIIGYSTLKILPERTKLDFIDWLRDSGTVPSKKQIDNADTSKNVGGNTVIIPTPTRLPTKKADISNKTTKNFGTDLLKTEVFIKADDQGRIYINNGEGITHLTQFCPEEWANDCLDDIKVKRNGNVFELNRAGLQSHQTAFNFRNAEGSWLSIPDKQRVTFGENIDIIIKAKGSHFVYIGQIPN